MSWPSTDFELAKQQEIEDLRMNLVMQVKLEVEGFAMAMNTPDVYEEFYRRMPEVMRRAYTAAGLPVDEGVISSWIGHGEMWRA